jgi:branched-chain amino acid aminotransferase
VLLGITRRTVIEIAHQLGLPVHAGDLPVGELYRAEELFLTSTAGGVMPVANLDGQPVGSGKMGAITEQIRTRYWDLHTDPTLSFAVDYSDQDGTPASAAR